MTEKARHRLWLLLGLSLPLVLGQSAVAAPEVPWPVVTLSKSVSPSSTDPGGTVTYTITLTNSGDVAAQGVTVVDTLPNGFGYQYGSSRVYANGILISSSNPNVSGRNLTWSNLSVPERRGDSFYGMHTFVQERCETWYFSWQLDRVRELMGYGAWVKQLFYGITPQTQGPHICWVDFVNAAYDRGLKPVIRLQGEHAGSYWHKPPADSPGNYSSIAWAFQRVVAGLPRRDGHRLYIEIWNEPNLNIEWGNAANTVEYGHFLEQTAAAIRALGDSRIVILNGGLSPGGDIDPLTFIDQMVANVPNSLWAWDIWSAHPYPSNHPPEYNIHRGSATYPQLTIDSYRRELQRLADWGRLYVKVLLTETGYNLGNGTFNWEGYPTINESNRADYIKRAFRDYWIAWPEIMGICPYELSDPLASASWIQWDWLTAGGDPHDQYGAVQSLDKSSPYAHGNLIITFRATATSSSGTYYNDLTATASNTTISPRYGVAPVSVIGPTPTPTITPTPADTPTITPTPTPTPTVTPTPTPFPTCVPDGWEPDDTPGQASLAATDGSVQYHTFHHSQDEDWAHFPAQAGVSYLVETSMLGYGADTQLAIFGPDGQTLLAENDDCQGHPRSCVLWPATSNHTAYVRVRSSTPVGANCKGYDYFLSVRALSHSIHLPLLTRDLWTTAASPAPSGASRPAGRSVRSFSATDGPAHSLLVHPYTGWLYAASDGLLTVSDPASGVVLARVSIGQQPRGMALDPVAGRLYVTSWERGSVAVFDARSGQRLAEARGLLRPSGLALAGGQLYVAETAAHRLLILDSKTAERRGEIRLGPGPYTLAASADGERVYVALAGSDEIAVLDTARDEVIARTALGGLGFPQDVAVDTATGRVYVLYLLAPRYRNVAIIDGRSGKQVGVIAANLELPLDGAQALTVDVARQQLYVSDAGGLQVFSTTTNRWLETHPAEGPANPFGLAVDPRRGQVYAALPGDKKQLAVYP